MLPFEFSKLLSIANQQSQRLLEALEINICRNLLNQDDCIHLSHVYFISAPKGQDVINNNCSNLHFSPQFALSCKSFFVAFRRELRNILLILELFTRVTILYGNEPTCLRFSFQNRNLFTNYSKPRVTRVLRVCQNIPSRAAIMAASLCQPGLKFQIISGLPCMRGRKYTWVNVMTYFFQRFLPLIFY